MKQNILLISLLFVSNFAIGQIQLGQTLFESYSTGYYFNNIDVNFDGSVFVVGNLIEQEFKVFELIGNEWKQRGQTLGSRNFLSAIISEDGNTVVANERDRIGIYRWDGTQWAESQSPVLDERVKTIDGLSASGSCNRVCVYYIDTTSQLGVYEVFEWRDDQWNTMGNNITIENPSKFWWGTKVEFSGDGSTLITSYSEDPNFHIEMVEVFKFSGADWIKEGETIKIFNGFILEGDMSISHDGSIFAISNINQIKVFRRDGQNWVPKGDSLSIPDFYQGKIELDGIGNRLAFSQFMYSTSERPLLGKITLLEFDGQHWRSIGPMEQGDREWDEFGTSLGLSANGKVLVAAAEPLARPEMNYIKAFIYGGVKYKPISYISSSMEDCDRDRIVQPGQYSLQFKDGENSEFILAGNQYISLPVWDSISISAIEPTNFRASPKGSNFGRNDLEAYNDKPDVFIPDTFCLIPYDLSTVDVRIDIIIPQNARPGFSFPVLLKYTNVGTKTVSGNVEFYFDGQIQEIISTIPRHDLLGANHVRWNYEDLLPLESRDIELTFELNRPTDDPPLNGGERLLYSAKVEPVDGDANPQDNQTEATIEVVNSFDPNDKRCMQGDTISPESVGSALTYVIRFENLGTAEAIDVRIRDVIDTTMLDISTFEMIDASHDGYMVEKSDGNIIDFIFKGINLPFDDENNDGHVAFNMHTKKHLQLGDSVKNDAAIYFDFNHPVITNEMITLVADQPTSIPAFNPQLGLSVYPNPASDMARVNANTGILQIDLIDIQGRQLRQEVYIKGLEKTREISVNGLSQGNYWLRVTTDEGIGTIPLMVK